LSESALSYDLEQLEPSAPPPRDVPGRLLAQARAEAAQIRAEAREQGLQEGRRAGLAAGTEELGRAATALAEAIAGVLALREQEAESVERDAIELAIALAGKILAGSLEGRPELVAEIVQGALRRVAGQRTITILLNPADIESVGAALGELRAQAGPVELCDLQPDRRIEPGGAVVRTAEGELDARVQTQLERAREVVAAELAGGRTPE
jgi:flagellar biosynthesis/type III secretory pathway protein FliH